MKKKRGAIVIAGYYGFGNAGDELILASLIQQQRNMNLDVQITVLSQNPEQTAARFNVNAVNRWKPWAWIKPLWHSDLFILGGGGLLQESTGPWNHAYYLFLVMLAKALGCRTEVRAIGVDPDGGLLNRIWTRFVFNALVNFASVRDSDSQRSLENFGVQVRIWRTPDPVFYLELPKTSAPAHETSVIGWAVSPWAQRPGWEHDISVLLERLFRDLNVSHELMVFFPEQDEPLARRIKELASCPTTVRVWEKPEDILSWIQSYDLIVAQRYHALVLSARAHKPFVGWGAQPKVRVLCRDFNQPMWTFERGWDGEAVYRQILDAWKRRQSLPERYREPLKHLLATPAVATETAHIFVAQA